MPYKYSLLMIITLVASHIAFAIENPFDIDLSEKIYQANEDVIKEGKETLKNLTGALIHLKSDKVPVVDASLDATLNDTVPSTVDFNDTVTVDDTLESTKNSSVKTKKDIINESKRDPFINKIVHLYGKYKFAMIAGGAALFTGICALLYKAYQKYYEQNNTSKVSNTQRTCLNHA